MLGTARPSTFAGMNFQVWAACRAWLAKYWLGPGEAMDAWETSPAASTSRRISTLTWPCTPPRIFAGMAGRGCCVTDPLTTPLCKGSAAGAGGEAGCGGGAGAVEAVGDGATEDAGAVEAVGDGAIDGAGAVTLGGAGTAEGAEIVAVTGSAAGVGVAVDCGTGAGAGEGGVRFQPNLKVATVSNRTRTAPARILTRSLFDGFAGR